MPTQANQPEKRPRHLVLVLGDQLDGDSAAFEGFDAKRDAIWMAEASEESTHVWTSKMRIAIFLSAMRHFRDAQRKRGRTVHYDALYEKDTSSTLRTRLRDAVQKLKPEKLIVIEPGEHRVQQALVEEADALGVELDVRIDGHFYCTTERFNKWAEGRKSLRLEYFYREMRREHDVLMEGDEPIGGAWNFDKDNRGRFSKDGPGLLPEPKSFKPDKLTREVIDLVNARFASHPGTLDDFDWPVTPKQAAAALDDFIEHRLAQFGAYQDAMWTEQPYLYHARLSAALNLHLLGPRDVVAAAEKAYADGDAPINAVEGFIRQIIGWREYVRGVYWRFMPQYLERNTLGAKRDLPDFYWTGETDMRCLGDAIQQTLRLGYAHHIQRLMVTGLFAMLFGAHPKQVHAWYLSVYVDAVEWVELPNTTGMSQFADDGVMASKPYCASGNYINRMSNYCKHCRYKPGEAAGDDACPFTTLYWDFLQEHREPLSNNNRMSMQLKNLDRKDADELKAIRRAAKALRERLAK